MLVVKRDNSPELLTKADGLFKEGKNAESRVEYLAVLAAHPELTAINRAIAFTYGREKNHPEALKYLDLALTANPNDATLLQTGRGQRDGSVRLSARDGLSRAHR